MEHDSDLARLTELSAHLSERERELIYYPPSAIRQEVEGKAPVRVCVEPNGQLAEAPQIARSSRYRLLDDAALRLARAGTYVAGLRDGVPIMDCFNFQVVFNLKNGR